MPTKILIIDDDKALTELTAMLLNSSGFEAITCNKGLDSLRLITDAQPDVIILDLMMSDMDGWQICKGIRAFSNIPIIVLSAVNDPDVVAGVLDLGADDFLVKPVPSAMLIARIKKIVRRIHLPAYTPQTVQTAGQQKTAPLLS